MKAIRIKIPKIYSQKNSIYNKKTHTHTLNCSKSSRNFQRNSYRILSKRTTRKFVILRNDHILSNRNTFTIDVLLYFAFFFVIIKKFYRKNFYSFTRWFLFLQATLNRKTYTSFRHRL